MRFQDPQHRHSAKYVSDGFGAVLVAASTIELHLSFPYCFDVKPQVRKSGIVVHSHTWLGRETIANSSATIHSILLYGRTVTLFKRKA